MALHDRLLNAARVQLPGASDAVLATELLNVIDEACREGWIWRETITVPFVEDTDTYAVAPDGTEVVHVFSVSHGTLDVSGTVYEFGSVTIPVLPTAAIAAGDPFYVIAALTPAHDAEDPEGFLPEDMWSEHHLMLLSGLLSRLMLQPAKPYSNPTLGMGHRRMFTSRLAQARRKTQTGGVAGGQLWRFPRHTR